MPPRTDRVTQLVVALLLVTVAILLPDWRAKSQPAPEAGIQDFDFSTDKAGWVLLEGQLLLTTKAGQTWTDITPPLMEGMQIGDAFFAGNNGWAVLTRPAGESVSYELAVTTDSGGNWQVQDLTLFSADEAYILPQASHLFFLDAQTGWLVIRQASSVNFSLGFLFRTTDGGLTWERLSIPIGEPVFFETAELGWTMGGVSGDELYRTRDGGRTWQPVPLPAPDLPPALRPSDVIPPTDGTITRLDQVSEQVAWAEVSAGDCSAGEGKQRVECVSSISLQRTLDGGQTWQAVSLPSVPAGILEARTVFTSEAMSAPALSGYSVETVTGQGFDMCEMTNLSKMQMWWDASPYTAVNLYIGGAARGCGNTRLSASFLTQLEQQGWKFIPTWVGPQAPCSAFSSLISADPAIAYTQGINEADAALATAASLGLADPALGGTLIYYDMEAYNSNDLDCKTAVNEFLRGWVDEMEAKGNVAGMYGSSCGSALTDVANIINPPEAIWVANWIFPSYDASATVWDAICLSNDYWPNHQRIRQYTGGSQRSVGWPYPEHRQQRPGWHDR